MSCHLSEKWEGVKSRDVMSNLSCYLETFSCSNAFLVILELFGDIPNYQIDGFYFVYTVLHLNFFATTTQGSNPGSATA